MTFKNLQYVKPKAWISFEKFRQCKYLSESFISFSQLCRSLHNENFNDSWNNFQNSSNLYDLLTKKPENRNCFDWSALSTFER